MPLCLLVVMKGVDARELTFGDQVRLGIEPMLHLMPRQRALVLVAEVGATRDFVRRRDELKFISDQIFRRRQPSWASRAACFQI